MANQADDCSIPAYDILYTQVQSFPIPDMWQVFTTGKARKQKERLPGNMQAALYLLERDLMERGPELTGWPNYGKIAGKRDVYHCHLNKGKPRYVAVWKVTGDKMIEVRYVGTHENADYRRID